MSAGSAAPFMNPDRLRRIDAWAGKPLCFALTVVRRLAARVRHEPAPHTPRRVLFIELAEMGTTVLACPAVDRLRVLYPDCDVYFLLFKHIDESIRILDTTPDDHILTIDVTSASSFVRDTIGVLRRMRRLGIDTVINLEMFARFSAALSYLSGARTRVGFHGFTQPGVYIGDLLTHRVAYSPHLHTWQSLVSLVEALAEPPGGMPLGKVPAATGGTVPRLRTDEAAASRMRTMLTEGRPAVAGKRLILINPNASRLIEIRKWPLDRYAALVARLLEDPANACAIIGLASEREDAQYIVSRVESDRLVDMTGRTSLRQLIDLFNVADVLVSNDSGPAHFAALTGIHVVVFFGPETPNLYRPLTDRCTPLYAHYACSPCVSAYNQRKSACTDNRCLSAIAVDEAHAAVVRALA